MLLLEIAVFTLVAIVTFWGGHKYYRTIKECYDADAETRRQERERNSRK